MTVHSIALMVLSVLCALLLWVYVTETRGEDITKTYPGVQVVFEGESSIRESRELIITESSHSSVSVTLTGNRRTLMNLVSSDMTATVDVNNITRTGNNAPAPRVTFPSRTDTSAITAVSTNPSTVSFYVDKLDKKVLEVRGVFNGSAAEGYTAETLEFSPNTVIIYGPAKVLSQVSYAYVEVSRTDVEKTVSFDSTYVLVDNEGSFFESDEITFDTDVVNVTLPVSAVKEVGLTVDLVYGGGVTENDVKWTLEPNTITLKGDSTTLAGVNSISVARINLSQVLDSFVDTYRVVIPNDTEIIGGARETTLNLEIGGLYTRHFQIDRSRITCINSSEGYTWEIGNDFLDVVIRGPEQAVLGLSELNIRAVADLTQYGTATASVNVPVEIHVDGSTEVGAVGEYRVLVNIKQATDEDGAAGGNGGTEGTEANG